LNQGSQELLNLINHHLKLNGRSDPEKIFKEIDQDGAGDIDED